MEGRTRSYALAPGGVKPRSQPQPSRIVPGRRVLPEVLGEDLVDLAVAAPELERGLEERLHRHGQELDGVAGSVVVDHGLAAAQPLHLPLHQLHPFPAARRSQPRRDPAEARRVELQQVRELVDPHVIGVVGIGEALAEGGDGQDDRAPGMRLAGQFLGLERVVAIEVVRVEKHLRDLVPLVVGPADAERDRGGGHEQSQLVGHLGLDAGDALLGHENPHVVLEAAAQVRGQPVVVVVVVQEELAPPRGKGRREKRPAPRRASAEEAPDRERAGDTGGPAGRRARHRSQQRAQDRSRAEEHQADRRREPAVRVALEPHARAASSRPRTRASMLPPVTTAATGRPSPRHLPDRSAATPTAPDASATTWSSARSTTIASSISASDTSTTSSMRSRWSKTIRPMPPARPSASVGPAGYSSSGRPWRIDSGRAGDASGCTATIRTAGARAFTAAATPEMSPPPPTGTTIAPTSGSSSRISSPAVPCPAAVRGSSKAWTYVAPVRSTWAMARAWASS